jgi:hypothetical protein
MGFFKDFFFPPEEKSIAEENGWDFDRELDINRLQDRKYDLLNGREVTKGSYGILPHSPSGIYLNYLPIQNLDYYKE